MRYYWNSSFLFFLYFLFWGGATDGQGLSTNSWASGIRRERRLPDICFRLHFSLFLGARLSIEGGELFERVIDDDFVLTERACAIFMRQICEGIQFIHLQHVLHLDMKVRFRFLFLSCLIWLCFINFGCGQYDLINWMFISSRRISYVWRGRATGSS